MGIRSFDLDVTIAQLNIVHSGLSARLRSLHDQIKHMEGMVEDIDSIMEEVKKFQQELREKENAK